ncbi:protein of unknown function [Methylorubrum extorquens DM4]|uniref:Uncharacterized protein n=1 Tax=Methylorubrum extorquens (strain DSM 6343 / CIP 106787 / DM4) TaxID=661410 RepID=C7CJT8_METED|nr:protein of unknown function [Methylorubrum extorquens DM4]
MRDAFATENRFGGLRPTPATSDPLGERRLHAGQLHRDPASLSTACSAPIFLLHGTLIRADRLPRPGPFSGASLRLNRQVSS